MNNLIAATEIDAWAKLNPRRAQELLPELIVRLILCTSSKINDYNYYIQSRMKKEHLIIRNGAATCGEFG